MNNPDLKIIYSNVRNLTKNIPQKNFGKICTFIEFKCDIKDINCSYVNKTNISKKFKIKEISKKINLYTLKN